MENPVDLIDTNSPLNRSATVGSVSQTLLSLLKLCHLTVCWGFKARFIERF